MKVDYKKKYLKYKNKYLQTKKIYGGYIRFKDKIDDEGKGEATEWPEDVSAHATTLPLYEKKIRLIKWDWKDGHIDKWIQEKMGETIGFNPFDADEDTLQKCKDNLETCTERFGVHSMFFSFVEEFNQRMEEKINSLSSGGQKLDIEDIIFIKNMLLGYALKKDEEQVAIIIECNYTDLVRPCNNNNIATKECEQIEPNQYVQNIINNNKGSPFTAKGYTYDLLGVAGDEYGVTEVILPQGDDIKIKVIGRVSAADYFHKYIYK